MKEEIKMHIKSNKVEGTMNVWVALIVKILKHKPKDQNWHLINKMISSMKDIITLEKEQ